VKVASFLQLMGPVNPNRLISVDETSSCRGKKLHNTKGRTPSGEDAVMWEFKIKSIQFSVVAAYSPRGFTSSIFQRNCGSSVGGYVIFEKRLAGYVGGRRRYYSG